MGTHSLLLLQKTENRGGEGGGVNGDKERWTVQPTPRSIEPGPDTQYFHMYAIHSTDSPPGKILSMGEQSGIESVFFFKMTQHTVSIVVIRVKMFKLKKKQ